MADWRYISEFISMREVLLNPDEPWDLNAMSYNEDLTIDIVIGPTLPNATGIWDWEVISEVVPLQDVRDNPDLTWNMNGLSNNKDITLNDVFTLVLPRSWYPTDYRKYDPDYEYSDGAWAVRGWDDTISTPTPYWNWNYLSRSIPRSDIDANPHLPWRRSHMRPRQQDTGVQLTKDIILADTNQAYHWDDVIRADGMTIDILKNLRLPNAIGEIDGSYVAEHYPVEDVRAEELEDIEYNPGAILDDFLM